MPENAVFIIWSTVNETGIKIIDEQHREVIGAINALYDQLRQDSDRIIWERTLFALWKYAKEHFCVEEFLMKESGYETFDEHAIQHSRYIQKLDQLARSLRFGGSARELLDFLKGWWTGHINGQDRLYIKHLTDFLEKHPEKENDARKRCPPRDKT